MGSPLSRLMKKRTTGRMVSLTRSTPPSNVPLLTVAKDHLTVETSASDTLLQRFIDAAVKYVEDVSRMSMFTQARTLVLDSFPNEYFIQLYSKPIISVTSFTTYDELDAPTTTFADYSLDIPGTRLLLNYGFQWPVDLRVNSAVKIVYQTGHGLTAATLPPTLVQAVMLLVGHWYQNREAGGCLVTPELAYGVADIIGIEREHRL